MKSHYFNNSMGRMLLAWALLVGIGLAASSAVQAQWPADRNRPGQVRRDRRWDDRRDRDFRRNRDYGRSDQYGRNGGYGGYGNILQIAINQGYQDGWYTGSRDAQRGQSYNPQRSHFYRNGHGDNGGLGRYGNSYQYQQAYRNGFLRGYDQGFQRYGGFNQGNGNYGRRRFPW